MKIGFIGLGKMGTQLVKRLIAAGNEVVVYDVNQEAVQALSPGGAVGASSYQELVEKLGDNPVVWLMIPADFVSDSIAELQKILPASSLLIDGGNSNFETSMQRAEQLAGSGIEFMDVGTSGGILGLKNGFCLMVGGKKTSYDRLLPVFEALSTPNGSQGYIGPAGYGHYVKMVHNGIEYGMMQALAEGYQLLKEGPVHDVPLALTSKLWQHGSIVDSTLNKLTTEILQENPELDGLDGYVADSGEGRWTSEIASSSAIQMPVLDASLKVRKDSQNGEVNYSTKLLAAMRNKFGGHAPNKQ